MTTDQLTIDERAQSQEARDDERDEPRRRSAREWMQRHPSVSAFLVCFVVLSGLLLFKNRHLFTDSIHEDGDFAANSLLMNDAKHLDLFVGNYSRQEFHHPGPAAFYVQAGGEVLFHSILKVAPTPFDGQAMSILLLYAALVSLALMIVYDLSRQWLAVLVAAVAIVAFCSAHGFVLASTWMPYYYFAPFFLFLVAAGSVAAGNSRHLWCMALAGGLLVHGHVEFLFFVPLMALPAIVAMIVWGRVRFGNARRDWIAFGATIALFLLPIAINLVLHYPGEFQRYYDYSNSAQAGGHSIREATNYVLGFWSRDPDNGYALVALIVGVALLLGTTHPVAAVRRFSIATVGIVALATALFIYYAVRGVDDLNEQYIGFFYLAAPMAVMVVAAVGAVALLAQRPRGSALTAVVAGLVLVVASRGDGLVNTYEGSPNLPDVVHTLAATRADAQQPLVVTLDSSAWPDVAGVIVEADREGFRVCVQEASWSLIVTDGFICSPSEVAAGRHLYFQASTPPAGPVIAQLPFSLIIAGDAPAPQ